MFTFNIIFVNRRDGYTRIAKAETASFGITRTSQPIGIVELMLATLTLGHSLQYLSVACPSIKECIQPLRRRVLATPLCFVRLCLPGLGLAYPERVTSYDLAYRSAIALVCKDAHF